ncbi:CgeB family protein [Sphingomonas sp.]|uniref:CgeB family protein n=1 Tax=Sphingomonas sp. TaxID=28214 RepID=UPI003BAA107A
MLSATDPRRPIRAVMATEFWHGSTGRALAQGLRREGWDVAEVDLGSYLGRAHGLIHRIANRLLSPRGIAAYNREILDHAARVDAEVLVTVKGSYITTETLATLQQRGVRTVNFYPDVAYNHDGSSPQAYARYDQIVTTKSYHLDHLRETYGADRTGFVHHGYAPLVHARQHEGDVPYRWDISHIGNFSPYKFNHMLAVAQAFPERTIAVIGNGWSGPAQGTALERHVLGYPLVGDYFARAIEESRINVAMHHGPVPPDGWQDVTSTRTFEIPAAGGFMLHIDNDEVRSLFVPGEEIDIFADTASLCARIGYYLDHDDDRRRIAAAGHARCVPAYSLDARAGELAALLRARGIVRGGA